MTTELYILKSKFLLHCMPTSDLSINVIGFVNFVSFSAILNASNPEM